MKLTIIILALAALASCDSRKAMPCDYLAGTTVYGPYYLEDPSPIVGTWKSTCYVCCDQDPTPPDEVEFCDGLRYGHGWSRYTFAANGDWSYRKWDAVEAAWRPNQADHMRWSIEDRSDAQDGSKPFLEIRVYGVDYLCVSGYIETGGSNSFYLDVWEVGQSCYGLFKTLQWRRVECSDT